MSAARTHTESVTPTTPANLLGARAPNSRRYTAAQSNIVTKWPTAPAATATEGGGSVPVRTRTASRPYTWKKNQGEPTRVPNPARTPAVAAAASSPERNNAGEDEPGTLENNATDVNLSSPVAVPLLATQSERLDGKCNTGPRGRAHG